MKYVPDLFIKIQVFESKCTKGEDVGFRFEHRMIDIVYFRTFECA